MPYRSVLVLLAVLLLPGLAAAQPTTSTPPAWDALVAAAQREGKVVVIGPPDGEVRKNLPAAFKKRFGITVEYMGGRTSEQGSRLRSERNAGSLSTDVAISGVQSMATIFHREKMLAPLRPALILPEVVDASKWKKGELWFADPEQTYVLRLSNQVQPSFYINTSQVKIEDFKTGRDLFDPKWRGRISAEDPTLLGSGITMAARLFLAFGPEGVKSLYVDQKPTLSRDQRQMTDWLLRGTYPIAMNADLDEINRMRDEGMPVTAVYGLPELPASVSAAFGMIGMFEGSPNPAAAKVFVNWMASKEGMEIWSRARREVPTRNDIDETGYLAASAIPQPGVPYVDTYAWDFTLEIRDKLRQHMKELLGR